MLGRMPVIASPTAALAATAPAKEATEIHTRILRLTLDIEDSRRYWESAVAQIPLSTRATLAFEHRWFGAKSLERVRYLTTAFATRYDAFPNALPALRRWRAIDVSSRQAVCHWHMQLSDPLYRRFTGDYLVRRRSHPSATVDRDAVLRWVKAGHPDAWSEATRVQFASKLLSAALEAGLVSRRDPRSLLPAKITDHALAYLLYLLRETNFDGSLTENPYLASVGIDADILAARARALPGVTMRRMMHLVDFEWAHADLVAWAAAELP